MICSLLEARWITDVILVTLCSGRYVFLPEAFTLAHKRWALQENIALVEKDILQWPCVVSGRSEPTTPGCKALCIHDVSVHVCR